MPAGAALLSVRAYDKREIRGSKHYRALRRRSAFRPAWRREGL